MRRLYILSHIKTRGAASATLNQHKVNIMLKFQKRHTTVTRIWTKPQTQQTLKDLRAAGLTVNKVPNGYEAVNKNNVLFLRAMNGNNSYLVRAVDFLLA